MVSQCCRRALPNVQYIAGVYNPITQRSGYIGHVHCDSDSCPMCSAHRAEKERHRLALGFVQALKLGLHPVMITATIRHHRKHTLIELQKALAKAWNKTFSGRWYDDLCKEYLIEGKLKAWEPTYGQNGWHPHLHSLFFMYYELDGKHLEDFKEKITARYIDQLKKLGYSAIKKRAIDVRTATSAIADYIAKYGHDPKERTWGADAEIALAPTKTSHRDGLTPNELLDAALGEDEPLERLRGMTGIRDKQRAMDFAGNLYREYFYAFKKIHRINWGKNLPKLLDLDNAAAEYDAENPRDPIEESQICMVQLDKNEGWQQLLKLRDGRAELRAVIRTGDVELVRKWLDDHHISATIPEAAIIWQQQKQNGAPTLSPEVGAPRAKGEAPTSISLTTIPNQDSQHKPLFGATSAPASARGMLSTLEPVGRAKRGD